MTRRKILITSIGTGVGNALLTAINKSELQYEVVGINTEPFHSGVYRADTCYLGPLASADPQGWLDRLFEVIQLEKPSLVIPARDADVLLMSHNINKIRAMNTIPVCAMPQLVEECNDKLLSANLFRRLGLRYAETVDISDTNSIAHLVKSCGFPLILKPRFGTGTIGVKLIHTDKELKDQLEKEPKEMVLQEFLPVEGVMHSVTTMTNLIQDKEYSLQVVFGPKGNMLGWFASINTLENGLPVAVRTTNSPEIRRCVAAITGSKENFIGPFNFQGRMKDDEIVFFEANSRFTGITGTRAAMGFYEVDAIWSSFVEGWDYKLLGSSEGKYAFRNLEDTLFSQDEYDRLVVNKHLRRS